MIGVGDFYRRRGKRALDVVGASTALVVASPVLLAGVITVRVTLGRPVLFRQVRPGRDSRLFPLLKLRTMREATDAKGTSLPDEERLGRTGMLLRSTSIDELPTLINVIFNINLAADKYPSMARTMDLRVVARDNRAGGGGIHSDDTVINVVSTAGPFRVTSPNTATTWTFQSQTVTWDVANTTAAPLNTSLVDILLSTDGGNTFPITLLEDTPNDGSQTVIIPPMSSNKCRIKVQAANSVYWDMSNTNFTINITADVAGWSQY